MAEYLAYGPPKEHQWGDWHPWIWLEPEQRICGRCGTIMRTDDPKFLAKECNGRRKN